MAETSTCRHCERPIVLDDTEGWIDPEAGYDEDGDGIWRVSCDAHHTFTAEHEPTGCTAETGHLTGQDHRWQECPTYHDQED